VDLYLDIRPYSHGHLDAGDDNLIYWETCGNPQGKPAVVLHGGPGSGCSSYLRRLFNPTAYRIVLFDQRGAGRSTPHASERDVDLRHNTTEYLIADIERLRAHLDIERWLVFGLSWGSTLALAYAQKHVQYVSEVVLASVTTTSAEEIDWISSGVGMFLPEASERFHDGVSPADRSKHIVDAYHSYLMDRDPAIHEKAARNWCDWEITLAKRHPDDQPDPRYDEARFRLGFARLVTHYWRHQAWLKDGSLIEGAKLLSGVPGILVHGAQDLGTPPRTAWRLHKAWPGSRLIIVNDVGHGLGEAGMDSAIVTALERFL
jgi:proline iminopeptidase